MGKLRSATVLFMVLALIGGLGACGGDDDDDASSSSDKDNKEVTADELLEESLPEDATDDQRAAARAEVDKVMRAGTILCYAPRLGKYPLCPSAVVQEALKLTATPPQPSTCTKTGGGTIYVPSGLRCVIGDQTYAMVTSR